MNKESDKIVPVCKKRKQQNQRKIMHESIDSRASKDNEHYVDQFTFGFDSDDGTMMKPFTRGHCHHVSYIMAVGAEVNRNNANLNAAKRQQKLNTGESKIDISEFAHSAWKDRFGSEELQVIFLLNVCVIEQCTAHTAME
eukprot:scaffold32449_cov55-Attheya_sp.AAC.1